MGSIKQGVLALLPAKFTSPFIALVILLLSLNSHAATLSVPASDTDGTFTFSWSGVSTYATFYERAGTSGTFASFWGANPGSGSHTITRANGTWQYYMRNCTVTGGQGGSSTTCTNTSTYTIIIGPPPSPPTVTASFSPSTINEGQSSTLSWSSSNATSCSASGISGVSGTSGSVTYTAPSVMSSNLGNTVTVTCTGSGGSTSANATVTVNWVNDVPTISDVTNRTINEDASTGAIAFTVGDEETSAGSLSVTRASSNTTLIPTANVVLGGSGASRTVTVTPAANQYGTSTITLSVSDGSQTVSDTFVVTVNSVNDAPTISDIANNSTNEGQNFGPISFTVGDVETAAGSLSVTATSNNQSVVPNGNITLGGSGSSRTISIVPGVPGSATISVTVSDGSATASDTFTLTVSNLPASLTMPSSSTTGSYSAVFGYCVEWCELQENINGTWTTIYGGNTPTTFNITKTSDGTYNYRLQDCQMVPNPPAGANTVCTTAVSRSVVVDLPGPSANASFNNTTINEGGSSILSWSSTNASSCSATGVSGVSATSGSVTYTAPSVMSSNLSHTVTVTCTGGGGSASANATVTVNWVNDAPTISDVTNRTVNEDASTGAIAFTVGDEETSAGSLSVTSASSNTTLIPTANIVLGGSGASRTVAITPAANQYGTATITLTVSDGSLSVSDSFVVTVNSVNDTPTISDIANNSTNEGQNFGPISFTVGDVETAAGSLSVTATSNDQSVVPNGNITLGGSSSSRTISIVPGVPGSATISVTVSDGSATASDTFTLTVNNLPASLTMPSSSTTGSYSAVFGYCVEWCELQENINGTWTTIYGGNTPTTFNITKTSDGTYNYRLQDCQMVPNPPAGANTVCTTAVSRSVVVDLPAPVLSASFNKASVKEGESATFSWSASNANSCSMTGFTTGTGTTGNKTYNAPSEVATATSVSGSVTCSGNGGSTSVSDSLDVLPDNDAPTISVIPQIDTFINVSASSPVAFSINDIDNNSTSLTLVAISSNNTSLIPTQNVFFGGSGSARTVYVTPVSGQSGTANITVRVSDGSLTATSQLVVNVSSTPNKPVFSGNPLDTVADPANESLDGSVYYGGVKGSYSVGNDGSFNYDIPFIIPVGIQGMSPAVGVSYNSGAGNSVVGWGFSLNGFSYIHRCGANYKRDGRSSGINDSDDYRYCLDGSRLVQVGSNEYRTESESWLRITKYADYWEVKSQSGTVARYGYNANAKELSANGTHTWKQDRQQDTFGNYLTIEYQAGQLNGADYGRPSKITYTLNSGISNMPTREVVFGYEDRPDIISGYMAGRAYIENKRLSSVTIKNNGAELWTYSLGYVDENPNKTEMNDPSVRSMLDTVQRCFYNSGCEEALTIDWSHRSQSDYAYQSMSNTFSARRTEIQNAMGSVDHYFDVDGDGIEDGYKGPVDTATLNYYLATSSFITDTSVTYQLTPKSEYFDVDVNNDGYKDIVRFNPTIFGMQVYLNEPDGSGGRRISTTANASFSVASQHLSFHAKRFYGILKNAGTEHAHVMSTMRDSYFGYNIQFVDMNRDGLIDLVRTPPVCPSATICYFDSSNFYAKDISVVLNTGSGWNNPGSQPNFVTLYNQWDNDKQFRAIQFVDLNGDSYIDIYGSGVHPEGNSSYQTVLYSNATNDLSQIQFTAGTPYGEHVGDFDGDGLIDFANVDTSISVRRGTGSGFATASVTAANTGLIEADAGFRTEVIVDLNNDGLDDIVQIAGCPDLSEFDYDSNNSQVASQIQSALSECWSANSAGYKEQVWLSKGANAQGNIEFANPITLANYPYTVSPYSRANYTRFTDYNNDGIKENSPLRTMGLKELRIENISSEAQDIAINYQSFDMTSVVVSGGELPGDDHMKHFHSQQEKYFELSKLKKSDVRFGVESLEISDGIGGVNTVSYSYKGAKVDTASYGHLGFARIESTEQIAGESGYVRTESHYHQIGNGDYQLSRKLKRRSTFASEDGSTEVQLSDQRYKWKVKLFEEDIDSHPSPHYFAYVHEETAQSFDLNGNAIGTSVTRNYETTDYACDALSLSETDTVATYVAGTGQDVDYDDEGVLLNSITISCDASSADSDAPEAMTQIVAMQNTDVINSGERRGLVQTVRSASWFGQSSSAPSGDLWAQAVNGVSASATCSQIEAQTSPWQAETTYTFNSSGLMETKTVKPGAGAGKQVVTTFDYNPGGSLKTVTDSWTNASGDTSLGFTSRTTSTVETFNTNRQRVIVTTTPLGSSTAIYHTVFDTPVSQTDVNQLTTQTVYDQLGRITFVDSPTTSDTQIDYRTCDNCFSESAFAQSYTQTKTTGAAASRSYYDRLGRAVGTRTRGFDGSFVYTKASYNNRGLVENSSAPYYANDTQQITHTTYDVLNRPLVVTRPDSETTSFVYEGLKQQIYNVNGQVQTRYSSASGNVLRNFDNAGTPVDFSYWPNGSAKTTEVGGGDHPETKVCIGYDDMGRKNILDDPNTGRVTYAYNALGLLAAQTDAKGKVTRFRYDVLGRTLNRYDDATGANLIHTWSYDSQLLGLADGLTGKNTDGSNYQESYAYDAFGRPTSTSASYLGKSFSSSVGYDTYGRALSTTWQGGYRVASVYNAWGQVEKVVATANNQILWQADEVTALGQLTAATLGDNSTVERVYTPETGLLESIITSREHQTVQDQHFEFDALGNLEYRTDYIANITQAFCYDELNRLVAARTDSCSPQDADFTYDSLGNILTKTGVSGTYGYGNNAGPNAVTSANGLSYSYDANGNLTQSRNASNQVVRNISYSVFNTPVVIEKDTRSSHIVYGATQNRIKRTDYEGASIKRTTFYFGSYEETVEAQGPTRKIYYIGDFAQRVEVVDTGESYHEFLHKDHIGSVVAKTSDKDFSIDTGAFDPWGKRLQDTWNSSPTGPDYTDTSVRGFTGHEHLDPVGLIHMNGRVYDPELGRFLSPDPFVQAPYNTQNYNRYSYVWNNPLSLVDPSGYFCRGPDTTWNNFVQSNMDAASSFNTQMSYAMRMQGEMYQQMRAMKEARQRGEDIKTIKEWVKNNEDSPWSDKIRAALPGIFAVSTAQTTDGGKKAGEAKQESSESQEAKRYAQTVSADNSVLPEVQQGGSAGSSSSGQGRNLFRVLGDVLGKIWNLPNSILGFVFGGTGYILGNTVYGIHSVFGNPKWMRPTWSFGNNALQFENNPLSFMGALTLGNVINYGGGLTPASDGAHEGAHTYQGQWLGPLYLLFNIVGQVSSLATYPFPSLRGPSPVHGRANFMEIGPQSGTPRPWPWK